MSRSQRSAVRTLAALVVSACIAGCSIFPAHAPEPARVIRGPIPSRAIAPVHLMFLAFEPRGTDTQASGSFGVRATSAYSSIFENGFSADSDVVLDGELWRNAVRVRYGVSPSADLAIEVPVLFATSGFLDQFVETFHELLLFPNSGRESRPKFAYEMDVQHEGQSVYELEGDQLGFGDVPIVFTQRIQDESEHAPAIALRAAVELPLGSESAGFGNGAIDYGAGALVQRSWSRWTATGGVDYVITSDSSGFEKGDVEAQDVLGAQAGVEYRWNDDLSLLAGVVFTSSITHDIDIEELDSEILLIDVGVAWDLEGGSRFIVGFEEDAIAAAGPDFTLFAAWSYGW